MEQPSREFDAEVARVVFGLTTATYRDVFGDTLYIVDETAVRTSEHSTDASLIGASWERGYDASGQLVEFYGYICPAFSTDIAAAWLVVEKMHALGWYFVLLERWLAIFGREEWTNNIFYAREVPSASADTAPLAICNAALAALGRAAGEREG